MCKQIREAHEMKSEKINNTNTQGQKKKTNSTLPVYPVVDIPVPDLDWKKLSGKNLPCCMRLFGYVITKVLS
jgi:hypothetical protein